MLWVVSSFVNFLDRVFDNIKKIYEFILFVEFYNTLVTVICPGGDRGKVLSCSITSEIVGLMSSILCPNITFLGYRI